MSHHHKLRKETTCLNCDHEVTDRYCNHCGQENIETRQPFHYLFGHFVEDLTHYDHGFWKTFKTLVARPGKLIKDYLAGKRASQVPPVKLYIFVSFLAFFLPAILPDLATSEKSIKKKEDKTIFKKQQYLMDSLIGASQISVMNIATKKQIQSKIDSILALQLQNTPKPKKKEADDEMIENTFTSDSINWKNNSFIDGNIYLNKIAQSINHKREELRKEGLSNREMSEKFVESFLHNLPKLLFFYLPVFAFFLWLFYSKNKWLYFDHGIFTLYYFSYLLTTIVLIELFNWIGSFIPSGFFVTVKDLIVATLVIYPFIYFFLAQHRVYGGSKTISIARGLILFFLNLIGMLVFSIAYTVITFSILH